MNNTWIQTKSGVVLPPPALGSSKISISTLVDGGRNTNGRFVGSVIGDDKLKIDLQWDVLTPEQFMSLLNIFDRKKGGRYVNDFLVYDPRYNAFRTITMYVGDRSGTPYLVDSSTMRPRWIKDATANLVEV